jgi:hypothetical protein
MAFPLTQIVGSDGLVVGVSGGIVVGGGTGLNALAAVSNTSVAGSTAYVSVKVGSGRIFGMTIQTSGDGVITVTDGSGGTIITGLASTQTAAAPETFPTVAGGIPFSTALVVVGTASSPAVTVHFS